MPMMTPGATLRVPPPHNSKNTVKQNVLSEGRCSQMSKRVLVVDDSNLMRHRIVQCLNDAGHEVVGKAKDGNEAVELYQQLQPDVVTMDITMRGKDGITAAREILEWDPKASIILYTLLDAALTTSQISQLAVKKVIRKGDEAELLQTLAALP
jgi:two-component system, chemotaxis family, chemotaxis protein CheY